MQNKTNKKRSCVLSGKKTSVSLEEDFWLALKEMAADRGDTLAEAIQSIYDNRSNSDNLSSSIRLAVLAYTRSKVFHYQLRAEGSVSHGQDKVGIEA